MSEAASRGRKRRLRLVDLVVALVFAVELATGTIVAVALAILVTVGSGHALAAALRPAAAATLAGADQCSKRTPSARLNTSDGPSARRLPIQ